MAPTPIIVVDVHERQSGIPNVLERLGATVYVESLPAADYLVGSGVIVERKHVCDLHDSLIEGRLWRQLGSLRQSATVPYLIVEGRSIDDGPIGGQAIRGVCLSAIGQGIRLLLTRNAEDSAAWLYRLAVRCQTSAKGRMRPAYSQRPVARRESTAEAMLASVHGISVQTARAILARYGTIAAIIHAGPEDWTEVAGMGPHRAKSLAEALGIARTPDVHSIR